MSKPDGGPAFPQVRTEYDRDTHEYTGNTYSEGGMTLRDYFAGQALAGLLSDPNYGASPEDAANYCYRMADGMLAERSK